VPTGDKFSYDTGKVTPSQNWIWERISKERLEMKEQRGFNKKENG